MRHVGDRLAHVSQKLFIKSRDLRFLAARQNLFDGESRRTLICETGKWDTPFLTQAARLQIERVWKKKIEKVDKEKRSGGEKYYVLSMFPYPSGKLHMGHVRVYSISDAIARYHRLQGRDVIHPIGWDSFGLPAENAAKLGGVDPAKWTNENIAVMKEQLTWLCVNFDWDREISTCDPKYYKWTQWIFVQLMSRGLAYQREAMVNWDPVDETVLAAEQVDDDGKSWRSGAKVEKKPLLQWYIKTTAYAKELHDSLDDIGENWKGKIGPLQKWWIGKPEGTRVELDLFKSDGSVDGRIPVHVLRPEALFGAAFLLLAKTNFDAVKRQGEDDSLTAEVPLTGVRVPVIFSDEYPFKERFKGGRVIPDSVLGCPALCEEDKLFADERGLPYKRTIFSGSGASATLTDCHPAIDGLTRKPAVAEILRLLAECGRGGTPVSPFLTDWLISRQRYWGTPIPVVHCANCGAVPVPEDQLPVVLPTDLQVDDAHAMASPLASAPDDWLYVDCPRCGVGGAKRETDTMDTFVDSSWYFLRYLDPNNDLSICDADKASRNLPVDIYIGGKEHAILHLFYARFMMRFLRDIGVVDPRHKEPFIKLLPQGYVTGQSFRIKSTGQYIPPKEAILEDDQKMIYRHRDTGELLEAQYEKMSKSKFNGVDPQECVEMWGCDTTRLCMFSNKPPDHDRPWSLTEGTFMGTINWQRRLWAMVTFYLKERGQLAPRRQSPSPDDIDVETEKDIIRVRNDALYAYEENFDFEMLIPIKVMMTLSNMLRKLEEREMGISVAFERSMADVIIMLFPFAPMFAAELWRGLASAPWHYPELDAYFDWTKDVWEQKWPRLDDDARLNVRVLLNGKDFARLAMTKRDFDRLNADSVETLLEKHLFVHELFAEKCGGGNNGGGGEAVVVDGLTFDRPSRHSAVANVIMNSIPTVDSKKKLKWKQILEIPVTFP